jgi:Trk K+ transport system NAD-binding subunit
MDHPGEPVCRLDVIYPDADDPLHPGDLVVLTGTSESVKTATEILRGPSLTEPT